MARRFYQLPSLTGLNTFDACARQHSFTAAASELGVTLGAVSRQIKALEAELDCSLFLRHHRGVELTAEGLELYQVLSSSFQQIGRLCQELRRRSARGEVTVAATTAFASLWLMPRLGDFWQRHRDINLNHAISDNPNDAGFIGADVRIRYGKGRWRGERSVRLFADSIYPVCSPDFAARHRPESPQDLVQLPLLRLEGVDPVWVDWQRWFEQFGCDMAASAFRRFNNYVVALQAAEESQGVVLGWHSLVEGAILRGRLVRLGRWALASPGAYYLTWDEGRELSEAATRLRSWLLETGRRQ